MTIKDTCEFYNGTGFPMVYQGKTAGKYPFYKVGDISKNVQLGNCYLKECDNYIDDEILNQLRGVLVPANSIAFAKIGEALKLNRRTITSTPCLVDNNVIAIHPNEEILDVEYFYYFMKTVNMADYSSSTTVPSVKKSSLEKIGVPTPELNEQKRISNDLNTLSFAIQSKKDELSSLDELVKSRFIEMFENKDFGECLFKDICDCLRNGANIKQSKTASGYPITRIETLSNDKFNLDRMGYADIFDLEKYRKYLLQTDDILISHINSTAYLGRAVRYKGESNTPIIHGMNLLCARIKPMYNATYIEHYLKSVRAKDYIRSITKQAVNQASISTTELKLMPISVPPIELQNEFAEFVKLIDKSKFVCHSKNFLCDIFTFSSSTIAYPSVVSIFVCPKRC